MLPRQENYPLVLLKTVEESMAESLCVDIARDVGSITTDPTLVLARPCHKTRKHNLIGRK